MVRRYIKKPAAIEAVRWTGYNFNEIQDFVGIGNVHFMRETNPPKIYIVTETGAVYALPGDYVTKDSSGEVLTYTKKVFDAYFEEASE